MKQELAMCYLGVCWFKRLWPEGWDWVEVQLQKSPEWTDPSVVFEKGILKFQMTEAELLISTPVRHPSPDPLGGPIESVKLSMPRAELSDDLWSGFRRTHVTWKEEVAMHESFQESLSQYHFSSELLSEGVVSIFIEINFDPVIYLNDETFEKVSDDEVDEQRGTFDPIMLIVDHQAQPISAGFMEDGEHTWIPKSLFGQTHEELIPRLIRWRELLNPSSAAEVSPEILEGFYFSNPVS